MKDLFKPDFNYNELYELRDELYATYENTKLDSKRFNQLQDQLNTLDQVIDYIEYMDKDRDAKTYTYELTYSQRLIEEVNERRVWNRLTTLHYKFLDECDWNDSIPIHASIDDLIIKLDIEICDIDEIIKIYMTL